MVARRATPVVPFRPLPHGLSRAFRLLLPCGAIVLMAGIGYVAGAPAAGAPAVHGASHFSPLMRPPVSALPAPPLSLGIASTGDAICLNLGVGCPAGSGLARVTMQAQGLASAQSYPDVQVLFVLEASPLDGVFDPHFHNKPPILYKCPLSAAGDGMPCEESNGVPYFIANAGLIASGIASTNPHSRVSFGLIDYWATNDQWDMEPTGVAYHVDIGQFVPAGEFGTAVRSTFQSNVLNGQWYMTNSAWTTNFLHAPSITALYGALMGVGVTWENNTRHVLIQIGSTAPRDPNYPENYCVSPSIVARDGRYTSCYSATCEPSYTFDTIVMPACYGWVRSQDGDASHSIAALARSSPNCVDAVGGSCTIDVIDLWDTATDYLSGDWQTGTTIQGGGVGGSLVQANVAHVLQAGCDLAAATGGTWTGPTWFACPNGDQGSLQWVPHGPYDKPYVYNPTLAAAFHVAAFGPVYATQSAKGASQPIFAFIPFGSIEPASGASLQAATACYRGVVPLPSCQIVPSVTHVGGRTILGWNWSTVPSLNTMYAGDIWTASFNVMAVGPPFARVPVDACSTSPCLYSGSQAEGGLYTWATYIPPSNRSEVFQSFPLAQVQVEPTTPSTPPLLPPPPPPPPALVPVPVPTANPLLQPVGVLNTLGVGNVSLQGTAIGLLAAGFVKLTIKNKTVRMPIAAKSGLLRSKFEATGPSESQSRVGRFE